MQGKNKLIRARDAKRNIGDELLQAVREMKAGKAVRVLQIVKVDHEQTQLHRRKEPRACAAN